MSTFLLNVIQMTHAYRFTYLLLIDMYMISKNVCNYIEHTSVVDLRLMKYVRTENISTTVIEHKTSCNCMI